MPLCIKDKMTTSDIRKHFRVSNYQIRVMIKQGLPFTKNDKGVNIFKFADVEKYIVAAGFAK